MRKLKSFEHISLDGVIQVRGSGEDGDYPYGDWTAPYRSPADRDAILAAHGESFDLLLGRRTYDLSSRHALRGLHLCAWRELRSAAWPAHLRSLVGLLAEGAEQSYV